jgi:single-strand DNA-binding protein
MPASPRTSSGDDAQAHVNEVRLRGRLSGEPEERVLPSGDTVVSFRVVVDRPAGAGRARVDAVDCAAFRPGVRRSVLRWEAGDSVEVEGSLHRRFFVAGGGRASRYEVEVGRASRVGPARAKGRGTMTG